MIFVVLNICLVDGASVHVLRTEADSWKDRSAQRCKSSRRAS
jgi:hypothetical protein